MAKNNKRQNSENINDNPNITMDILKSMPTTPQSKISIFTSIFFAGLFVSICTFGSMMDLQIRHMILQYFKR